MSATRRQAAAGVLGAFSAALLPPLARAQNPGAIQPDEAPNETPTEVATASTHWDHMLAPVEINGQGPYRFLIDTGANASCVSFKLADLLSLPAGPMTRVHTIVGVKDRPSVMLDSLQVGTRNRKSVRAASLPIRGLEVDGVLGVDWLKGQRLVLDFKDQKIEITKSRSESTAEGRVIVPARRRFGQLTIVDADLGSQRISAMLDSGAHVSLCNAPLREMVLEGERGRGMQATPQRIELETVAGEKFVGEMFFLPFLRLGGLHLGNVPVVYADMHVFDIWGLKKTPALVLGMDLLRQFEAVSLDFGRSQVRFDFTEAQSAGGAVASRSAALSARMRIQSAEAFRMENATA